MKKEILTVQNIKKDIGVNRPRIQPDKKRNTGVYLALVLIAVGALVVEHIFTKISADVAFTSGKPILIASGAAVALGVILLTVFWFRIRKLAAGQKRSFKEFNIAVTEDTLVSTVQDYVYTRYEHRHLLVFENFGNYLIPEGRLYTWSKDFYMSDDGIYNTSVPGNTFYIAYYREDETRTPIMVYNTKFFEWNEDAYDT